MSTLKRFLPSWLRERLSRHHVAARSPRAACLSLTALEDRSVPALLPLAVADLNRDGLSDVVMADPARNGISVALGTPGGLGAVALYPAGEGPAPTGLAALDLTGDGVLDLLGERANGEPESLVNIGSSRSAVAYIQPGEALITAFAVGGLAQGDCQ